MGLSSLFAAQDRVGERLDAIERRLAELEAGAAPPAEVAPNAERLDRLLDRLESIEGRLERAAVPRKPSPSGRRTPR
jgi:BMFP domain-containing protein YqiC